jgi:hypothetical protein
MRKLILSMFAAAALIGCDREHHPVAPSEPGTIGFGTVDTRVAADLSTLKADGFGVWAYISNSAQPNYLLMENQLVEYDESEDKWFYSPVKYWLDDTKFSFIGVYPREHFSTDTENRGVTLTVNETPSEVDFLIAKNITDTGAEEGYSTTVDLPFQHILTSVGLNIWRDDGKHQNDQMRIKKVTLSNISKAGTMSSDSNTWEFTGDKLTVVKDNSANLKDTDNISAATVKDDGTLDTGGSTSFSPFGQMMLLPQTIESGAVTLKVEYELKRQNAADWESAELEAPLPARTWEAGRRYTYNVVLSSVTDITIYYLQTKVDQWGTPQVGGTVIIK